VSGGAFSDSQAGIIFSAPPPDLRRWRNVSNIDEDAVRTSRCHTAVMHSGPAPTSASDPAPGRYVVRLPGALAALLGRAEGTELPEDDLVGWLRAGG
jgi:hypothetical protein